MAISNQGYNVMSDYNYWLRIKKKTMKKGCFGLVKCYPL